MPNWIISCGRLDWGIRFAAAIVVSAVTVIAIVGSLSSFNHPLLDISATLACSIVATLSFRRSRHSLAQIDWRVSAILVATGLAAAGTMLTYSLGFGHNPATFFGAVFAGWVGGIALFALVGAAVAIVSLAKPEEESFDARARILFKRETGRHIDYIIARIKQTFEHYSESVESTIVVKRYDAVEGKFLIAWKCKTIIRSYIDDITTSYKSSVKLSDVVYPPPGELGNRLSYCRVAGIPHGGEMFETAMEKFFETTIPPASPCEIEHEAEYWLQADTEPNTYAPQRYTQKVTLIIENNLQKDAVLQIKTSIDGSGSWFDRQLKAGDRTIICETADIEPDVQVYDFRLCALTSDEDEPKS